MNKTKMKEMWDERYNVGVEEIDNEHQRLFSIIYKILELSQDEDEAKIKHGCREGVKFFRSYAIGHFEHEEQFMRSIDYAGYERHKKIHDDLKNNILPALEKELEDNNYDVETVRHFLGICTAWLVTHIKIEDQNIVQRKLHSQMKLEISNGENKFGEILQRSFKDILALDIEPISNRYTGWDFGKAIFHELTPTDEEHLGTKLLLILEQKLLISVSAKRLGIEVRAIDSFLLAVIKEMCQTLGKQLCASIGIEGDNYKSRSGVMLDTIERERIFRNKTILYSALFKCDMGHFACCVYKR